MEQKLDERISAIKEAIADIEKKYFLPEGEEVVPLNKEREMIACSLLVETMEENGATEEELKNVVAYCTIVADYDKLRLDWYKAYQELGIDDYCEKYIPLDAAKYEEGSDGSENETVKENENIEEKENEN